MFDFDPRDYDPRDDERLDQKQGRSGSNHDERDDHRTQSERWRDGYDITASPNDFTPTGNFLMPNYTVLRRARCARGARRSYFLKLTTNSPLSLKASGCSQRLTLLAAARLLPS